LKILVETWQVMEPFEKITNNPILFSLAL
jgi:hypothetical protein